MKIAPYSRDRHQYTSKSDECFSFEREIDRIHSVSPAIKESFGNNRTFLTSLKIIYSSDYHPFSGVETRNHFDGCCTGADLLQYFVVLTCYLSGYKSRHSIFPGYLQLSLPTADNINFFGAGLLEISIMMLAVIPGKIVIFAGGSMAKVSE